jgi:hypothetical protein
MFIPKSFHLPFRLNLMWEIKSKIHLKREKPNYRVHQKMKKEMVYTTIKWKHP